MRERLAVHVPYFKLTSNFSTEEMCIVQVGASAHETFELAEET